jgi:hypothetical protein
MPRVAEQRDPGDAEPIGDLRTDMAKSRLGPSWLISRQAQGLIVCGPPVGERSRLHE